MTDYKALTERLHYASLTSSSIGRIEVCKEAADAIDALVAELDAARRTAEYWKAEHLAGNAELARVTAERDAAAKDAERLRVVAREALYEVEAWACYASDYFRNKHDLVGTLARLSTAIDAAIKDHG